MRWKEKPYEEPPERRIIKKFLFLPKKIGDETRWLEWATILQTSFIDPSHQFYTWLDAEWIDE